MTLVEILASVLVGVGGVLLLADAVLRYPRLDERNRWLVPLALALIVAGLTLLVLFP